jgi:hypothetical protein
MYFYFITDKERRFVKTCSSSDPRGFLIIDKKENKPKISKALLWRIFSYLKSYWCF